MSTADDLTTVLAGLAESAGGDLSFRSGLVAEWNNEVGANTIVIAGTPISDLPILIESEKLAIQAGDVVGVLRWKSQYFVLGRISTNPGEIVVRDGAGRVTVHVRRTPAGGGEIITRHPNGVTHTAIGQLILEATGEIVGQGFFVQQDNGVDLFGIAPPEPGAHPIVRISDHRGVRAFATEDGPDGLLDRPYLDVPMWPVNGLGTSRNTTSGFSPVWIGKLWVTHPAIQVHVRAWTSAGETGRIAVTVDDVQLGSNIIVPDTGGAASFYDFGTDLLPDDVRSAPYSFHKLQVESLLDGGGADPQHITVIPYGVTRRGAP